VILTSAQNPRIKAALRLRDRRHRDREALCLVEGVSEVRLALEAGAIPVTLFLDRSGSHAREFAAIERTARAAGAAVFDTAAAALARLSYREHPDGCVAVLRSPSRPLDSLELAPAPLVLVVDGVEKPGNLGAMVRTAEAAGLAAVILSDPGTDPWNPNAVRASKGAVFSVPLAVAAPAAVIAWLRGHAIAIAAADPGASTAYTEADLRGPLAIVVGAEDEGLSQTWRHAADVLVSIPMAGRVNSLNVATSAALLVYEALRQRR
jgi:TrmH family RNA methyltransferase